MSEVIGPVIGITLVLMAVFLPDRLPGRHHRPALPPVRPDDRRDGLDQRDQRRDAQARPVRRLSAADSRAARTPFYRAFNAVYDRCEAVYTAIVGRLVRHIARR